MGELRRPPRPPAPPPRDPAAYVDVEYGRLTPEELARAQAITDRFRAWMKGR